MAPILSISKERIRAIREDVFHCVVSIWQCTINKDGALRQRTAFRTGFVLEGYGDTCIVITVREGLSVDKRTFVQFESGPIREASIYSGGVSRLAAIVVHNLPFRPNLLELSNVEARQCDPVVHMGLFHNNCRKLGLSSGSVGLVNHNSARRGEEDFTRFAHCCSQKQYMLGAPVLNLRGDGVGINFSKKRDKNIFFAMDLAQIEREKIKLFGEDYAGCVIRILGLEKRAAELKKRETEKGHLAKKRRMA